MKLGLYGIGGLGSEIREIAERINAVSQTYDELFFIDDTSDAKPGLGCQLMSFDEARSAFNPDEAVITICVGEPSIRGLLADRVRLAGFSLATLIHPEIEIPKSAQLGEGVIVYRYCNVGPNARIGANTALLTGANIPHDNVVGENCVLSTYATLSGNCTVGDNAYVAAGAVVKEGVSVGDWAIVGLGSAVFKDVDAEAIMIGNPAKCVGKNTDHCVFSR